MKPLIVLLTAFVLTAGISRLAGDEYNAAFAGRVAMSAMLVFTAIGHFAYSKGMVMMLPSFIPFKTGIVYLTGVIEVLAAIGLLVPPLISLTGWLLIVFFILILPANISAAMRGVDYQEGNTDGPGIHYLWFRVPLQLLFIVWVYVWALVL